MDIVLKDTGNLSVDIKARIKFFWLYNYILGTYLIIVNLLD